MAGSSQIMSGHDNSELYKGHCFFESVPMANSTDSPAFALGCVAMFAIASLHP